MPCWAISTARMLLEIPSMTTDGFILVVLTSNLILRERERERERENNDKIP